MKKSMIICFSLALGALIFSSCKKEYECNCLVTDSSGGVADMTTNIRATNKNKQKECEATAPESDFGKTCTVK